MAVLSSELRKDLEKACVRGRRASEKASRAAIGALAVADDRPPTHLRDEDRNLRRALCAKRDQLGDPPDNVDRLVADCAYEQWHRLLFARFLAENGLLIHPEFKAPVTLAECDDLAVDLGEPDAWAVAGRFATEILPGIFRLDDPCVRLRLAPEGRLELEQIVEGIPAETFAADDALGWVYQHWQKERKDEVNSSERKIGGADLPPVTQLFTENYMVRFLLENSLGAWWANRHPDSALVSEWEYLRFDDGGKTAAGTFAGWPGVVAEVTVMDPCCGSGHFLVEAFQMLWRMRAEEEGVAPVAAQDAVLRDNLFGLELDPRCVQIATFAVAMAAWRAGGRWRELPVPNIGCSGIPIQAGVEEWMALAGEELRLEKALARLHVLFRDADTLGSLIDPRRHIEVRAAKTSQMSLEDVEWDLIVPLLKRAIGLEPDDPAVAVIGADAVASSRAAEYLSRGYTLAVTNPPFLGRGKQVDSLRDFIDRSHSAGSPDLSTAFFSRALGLVDPGGCVAMVTPDTWRFIPSFAALRDHVLASSTPLLIAALGSRPFRAQLWDYPICLTLTGVEPTHTPHEVPLVNVDATPDNPTALAAAAVLSVPVSTAIRAGRVASGSRLSDFAMPHEGLSTGDGSRYTRFWWETPPTDLWERLQVRPSITKPYGGAEEQFLWERGTGSLARDRGARIQGLGAWGKSGVLVERQRGLRATRYLGTPFFKTSVAIIPHLPSDVESVWHFCSSDEYRDAVRARDPRVGIATSATVDVAFDVDRWRRAAQEAGPLPEPWSDDPTQWLFDGRPDMSVHPLQVAVARLLGYRWPAQPEDDGLNAFADDDGIVCLPSVRGEATAADRLHELLARAFGGTWSPARAAALLAASGTKKTNLDSLLRDEFFKAHCQVFKNRPFVWHVWDGRKDGFAALVNYHKLNRPTLERLTYTYLGDWIERQAAAARDDVVGAAERLVAARDLQRKLELILGGEPPYDIYVRWKPAARQAIGWAPDLDDGVRLNVRPFVQAGVLRANFNVKWEKDRGKNPDGSERHNDLHLTNAEKQAARGA